jgi:hypothetical protein
VRQEEAEGWRDTEWVERGRKRKGKGEGEGRQAWMEPTRGSCVNPWKREAE